MRPLLQNLRRVCCRFITEEDGTGTAVYGAALAFAMLGAGLVAGCLLF
jgi:hypothetical protein